jgi:predicted ester cyclase
LLESAEKREAFVWVDEALNRRSRLLAIVLADSISLLSIFHLSTPLMPDSTSLTQFAEEWFARVWNGRDESSIDRMLNPSGGIDGLRLRDATSLRGPAEFKVFYRSFISAFPDMHITVEKTIEQGDWLAVKFVCEGTHTGEGLGVPPSNKPVRFSAIAFGRVENGQWVEGWNCVDFLSLNQQIGGQMRIG